MMETGDKVFVEEKPKDAHPEEAGAKEEEQTNHAYKTGPENGIEDWFETDEPSLTIKDWFKSSQ